MTTTINAVTSTGLVQTSDGSGIIKVQSNGVTTNALAWVNFAGASGSVTSGYNVSSVTRNAAGYYSINFTSALTDANYTAVGTAGGAGSRNAIIAIGVDNNGAAVSKTTSVCPVNCYTGSQFDSPYIQVAIFGN